MTYDGSEVRPHVVEYIGYLASVLEKFLLIAIRHRKELMKPIRPCMSVRPADGADSSSTPLIHACCIELSSSLLAGCGQLVAMASFSVV